MKLKWAKIKEEYSDYSDTQAQHFIRKARLDIQKCNLEIHLSDKMPFSKDCAYWRWRNLRSDIKEIKKALERKLLANQKNIWGHVS